MSSQKESAELRQIVPPGATLAYRDQVQIRSHLGVRESEDAARELDQHAFVPERVQISPVYASVRRISGPENTARALGQVP